MWNSPPAKTSDKSLPSSSRCHHATTTASAASTAAGTTATRRNNEGAPRTRTAVSGLSDSPPASPPVIYVAAPALLASSRRAEAIDSNHGGGGGGGNMLTLDEFLRETSRASGIPATGAAPSPPAAPAETERRLHTMLLMGRDRRSPADRDASLPPRSPPTAGSDSFDTLVTQIRRIGALQDAMLSNVDNTTTSLEDYARRERNRSAVDSLRIREARLRAMQTRIDLLASEFQLLRSTRRELRRVCCVPLVCLSTASLPIGKWMRVDRWSAKAG